MKPINFIKPIPPGRQKELRRWYWLTAGSLGALLTAILIISSIQGYLYWVLFKNRTVLSSELGNYGASINQQKKDQSEHDALKKKIDRLNQYRTNPKNPSSVLQALKTAGNGLKIRSVTITPKNFEIQLSAHSIDQITQCMKLLHEYKHQSIPFFANLKLASLSHRQQLVDATIAGTILHNLKERI